MAIEVKGLYKYSGRTYVLDKDYNITIGTVKAGSKIFVFNVTRTAPWPFGKLVFHCRDEDTGHEFGMYEDNFIEHVVYDPMPQWFMRFDQVLQTTNLPYVLGGIAVLAILIRGIVS